MKYYYENFQRTSFSNDCVSFPKDIGNRLYCKALEEVEAGEAEFVPYVEPEPTPEQVRAEQMLAGVEFEGVMCSAVSEDMWGLAAIKDYIRAGLRTKFKFCNGNTLLLTPDNIDAFEVVWVPFRAGFFD